MTALTPMEMARAIRREKELIGNRQGQRSDLTFGTGSQKLHWHEEVAKTIEMSPDNVRRLDKLNELIKPLQTFVDQNKLSIKAADQLAYLTPAYHGQLWFTCIVNCSLP